MVNTHILCSNKLYLTTNLLNPQIRAPYLAAKAMAKPRPYLHTNVNKLLTQNVTIDNAYWRIEYGANKRANTSTGVTYIMEIL